MVQEGKATGDACGIVISYSVRIKLNCGTLGGEMQTDVPFKLLQPAPGELQLIIIHSNPNLIKLLSFETRHHREEAFKCHEEDEVH